MQTSCHLIRSALRLSSKNYSSTPVCVPLNVRTPLHRFSKSRIVVEAKPSQAGEFVGQETQIVRSMRLVEAESSKSVVDDCEYNIGAYCSIDNDVRSSYTDSY